MDDYLFYGTDTFFIMVILFEQLLEETSSKLKKKCM